MDELGNHTPEGAEEFVAPETGVAHQEVEVTPELIKQCEETAREFIIDPNKHDKFPPVRFLYSAELEKPFTEGFEQDFFHIEPDGYALLAVDARNRTMNDGFTRAFEYSGKEILSNRLSPIALNRLPEDEVIQRFTELTTFLEKENPDLARMVKEGMTQKESEGPLSQAVAIELAFLKYNEQQQGDKDTMPSKWVPIDVATLRGILVNVPPEVQDSIVGKLLSSTPFSQWSFEEKEIYYDASIREYRRFRQMEGEPIYDTAVFLDPDKPFTQYTNIMHEPTEKMLTASPEAILGTFAFPTFVDTKRGDFIAERLKRTFYKHPDLSRPIYSHLNGGLLWPPPLEEREVDQQG